MNGLDIDIDTDEDIDNNIDDIENIMEDGQDDDNLVIIDTETVVEPGKIYIPDNLKDLPGSMEIFAITLTGSISVMFYIENILDYLPLDKLNISTVKSKKKIRCIKKKKQKKSKSINATDSSQTNSSGGTDNFFNQITVVMNIPVDYGSSTTKDVNIKLFKNGSIQVSGIKSIPQCNIMINKLVELLKGEYCIFVDEDGTHCPFGTPGSTSKIIRFIESDNVKILNIKLNMINTMFQYQSKINRSQLYMRLIELKMTNLLESTTRLKYQPDIHAPVHVKIDLGNKKPVTVFVFESGKILIMAAKRRENIIDAYNYINKLLEENHEYVVKRNLIEIIANDPDLCKLIDLEALSLVVDDL
jgi:TATA-box binding protein (TBP) (component of TFIID and TFIIIB)